MKIANDIRWLAPGPRCGLARDAHSRKRARLVDHARQGESHAVRSDDHGCVQVHGNNAAVAFAGSQGNFELNVFKPVMIYNFLHSVTLLTDACHGFVDYMVRGIELNRAQIDEYVENSLMLVTALSPRIGYDKAAKIAHDAYVENLSLREACLKLGYLSGEEFDELVRPEEMTHP